MFTVSQKRSFHNIILFLGKINFFGKRTKDSNFTRKYEKQNKNYEFKLQKKHYEWYRMVGQKIPRKNYLF